MVSSSRPRFNPKPTVRRPSAPPEPAVGIVWYTEQEWAKVKVFSADAEAFEKSYADWVDMAEKALMQLQAQGLHMQKTLVQTDQLMAWCIAHGKPNDGSARAEYVVQMGLGESDG